MFWRLSYNVGLGFILHKQSNGHFFVKYFEKYILSSQSRTEWFARNVSTVKRIHDISNGKKISKLVKVPYEIGKYPKEYSAWLLYRTIVDVILVNDVVCYILFALSYYEAPESFSLQVIGRYLLGFSLCALTLWAKLDAHRVIGDFSWYWADFFFLIKQELTFDGVFNMIPHPMYTLAYTWFYGVSLISGSYTVLYISFLGHFCQLCFLAFVEEPHIQKTYNTVTINETEEEYKNKGYLSGFFMFFNLNIWEESNFFFIVINLYIIISGIISNNTFFHVFHVIAWRLFHTVFLGWILKSQSENDTWNKKYISKGFTKHQAFHSWKKLYNCSLTCNHIVYVICALRCFVVPENWNWSIYGFKCFICGILIALQIYVSVSSFEVLGEYGWFFGDFFLTNEVSNKIKYHGIFRYVDNPETLLGFSAYYGIAFLSHSKIVFLLAIFCHICSGLFTNFVEKPHMERTYGSSMRKEGGIEAEVKSTLKPFIKAIFNELENSNNETLRNVQSHISNLLKRNQEENALSKKKNS